MSDPERPSSPDAIQCALLRMYFDPNAPESGASSCSEFNDLCETDVIKSPDFTSIQNRHGGTCRILEVLSGMDILGGVRLARLDVAEDSEYPGEHPKSA